MKNPKFLRNNTFHPKNIAWKKIHPVYRTLAIVIRKAHILAKQLGAKEKFQQLGEALYTS